MTNEKNKTVDEFQNDSNSKCQEKIEKLNNKLQTTANELEDVSALYARSVKEGLNKSKQIKELEDKIAELEAQLKDCQKKREELEKQLKECQEKSNIGNKKIWTALKESNIPIRIFSITTDKKGNVYIGSRSDSWHGNVYKCSAGESAFKSMSGIDGEIWTLVTDEDDNIYAGTREEVAKGGVYKCSTNENKFNKIAGINKCVSALKFEGDTLLAKVWTGIAWDQQTSTETYKLIKSESEFKPTS